MRLRNKKTGEIIDLEQWRLEYYKDSGCITLTNDRNQNGQYCYGAFADMKDEWEDCKPSEPLIKDEKIRKAVRAWWEAVPDAITDKRILYKKNQDLAVGVYSIYCGEIYPETLEAGKMYTIDELCGEEEE